MKKQILAIALIGALICLPALADMVIRKSTVASMDVSMTIEEEIPPITIPAQLPIAYGSECEALTIRIDEMHLIENHRLRVSAQTDGALVDVNDAENAIVFSVSNTPNPIGGEAELYFEKTGAQDLYVHIPSEQWDEAVSGSDYSGTITFVFSIESVNQIDEPNEGGDTNA